MKREETIEILKNAADYSSPEIRMYSSQLELAELSRNTGFIRSLCQMTSMYSQLFRIRAERAIAGLRDAAYDSSVKEGDSGEREK